MTHFALTVRFPGGSPLIGGAAVAPADFHASHAALADGRPYIPATALRGALRETLEALLRGAGQRACAGGDGVDPEVATSTDNLSVACTLGAAGALCIACRVFGTRRLGLGDSERASSALVLGDAMPTGDVPWTTRPSVAVDRSSRSAADQHLRFQRVPQAGSAPLEFVADGRVIEASLMKYVDAAVQATTHVGSGRSRGLAHVEMALEPRTRAAAVLSMPASDILVRVTLTSPALVGVSTVDANYRETRHEIPGATLRGAVGFALRELLPDADRDAPTQALVDEVHGAQFGFLYPVAPQLTDEGIRGPLPITAAACKRAKHAHGVVDTLLDRLALWHAATAEQAERAARDAITQCAQCAATPDKPAVPLRTIQGSRRTNGPPKTRTIVRVAMDRTRQSARDGQLFSQVLLEAGVVLEGTIRNIPAGSRQRLAQALGSGILSFGRGRASGWGRADVEVVAPHRLPSLAERAAAFDRALRARLDQAKLPTHRVGRLVPITLLSPLWPSELAADATADGARDLGRAVGDASCVLPVRRFAREGAWDQRRGKMSTFRATVAGGVFVLELRGATWRDLVPRLEALERDGAGLRRDQGYGQLLCFDPHFLVRQQRG